MKNIREELNYITLVSITYDDISSQLSALFPSWYWRLRGRSKIGRCHETSRTFCSVAETRARSGEAARGWSRPHRRSGGCPWRRPRCPDCWARPPPTCSSAASSPSSDSPRLAGVWRSQLAGSPVTVPPPPRHPDLTLFCARHESRSWYKGW